MLIIDQDKYPFGPDRSGLLQEMCNKLKERGHGWLHIEGRHQFSKVSDLEVPNTPYENGISITGDGEFATSLIATPDNRSGILRINRLDNQPTVKVSDMAFLSPLSNQEPKDVHNGVGLMMTATNKAGQPGFGDHRVHSFIAQNLFIGPDGINPGDTGRKGRFQIALNVEQQWYPKIDNVRVQTNSLPDVSKYGIKLLDCYDAWVYRSYVHGRWQTGISFNSGISGETYEGGRVESCNIVNPDIGLWVDHVFDKDWLFEPGFHLLNCHINPYNHGAIFTRHRHLLIQGNQFYAPNHSGDRSVPQTVGLWLAPGAEANIIGNQFLEPGYYHDNANCSVGIKLEEDCQGVLIDGNIFNTGGIGIYNKSKHMRKNTLGLNTFSDGQRDGQWANFLPVYDPVNSLRVVKYTS